MSHRLSSLNFHQFKTHYELIPQVQLPTQHPSLKDAIISQVNSTEHRSRLSNLNPQQFKAQYEHLVQDATNDHGHRSSTTTEVTTSHSVRSVREPYSPQCYSLISVRGIDRMTRKKPILRDLAAKLTVIRQDVIKELL